MPNDLPFFNSHKRQFRNKIRCLTNFLHHPRFVLLPESQNVDLMNGSIILLLLRLNRNHPKTLQTLTFPCLIIKYLGKKLYVSRETLFSDAELFEDSIQNFFGACLSNQLSKRFQCRAEF